MSQEQLSSSKGILSEYFRELEESGISNAALAAGPQTIEWIRDIQEKMK